MNAQEFMALVASQFDNRPDDYVLSFGHWDRSSDPPKFYADIAITMGEVRAMTQSE